MRLQIVSRLFSQLVTARQRLNIDSDSQQILFAFKLAGLSDAARIAGPQGRFEASDFSARLNASTVSNMTGIPRETVRRKLQKLVSTGLLACDGRGAFTMDRYWQEFDVFEMLGRHIR